MAGKVIGVNQMQLFDINDWQVVRKALAIMDCSDLPLQRQFVLLLSGKRYRYKVPIQRTNGFKVSFICAAIRS